MYVCSLVAQHGPIAICSVVLKPLFSTSSYNHIMSETFMSEKVQLCPESIALLSTGNWLVGARIGLKVMSEMSSDVNPSATNSSKNLGMLSFVVSSKFPPIDIGALPFKASRFFKMT